jgi:hypothetical protein
VCSYPLFGLLFCAFKIIFIVAGLNTTSSQHVFRKRKGDVSNPRFTTHKSRLDNPMSSTLVQAEVLSLSSALVDGVFCDFDLFEVLLDSRKFCKDRMFAGFDSMETEEG